MMRSSNPALRADTFRGFRAEASTGTMSLEGTALRTGILLVLALTTASYAWKAPPGPWLWVGLLGGLAFSLVTCFWKSAAPFTAPLYALCQGLLLGAISARYEARFGGIVVQAVFLTFGTLAALLAAYATRLIRANENFKLGVFAATGGIALFYLADLVLGFFGIRIPHVHGNGLIGIGFSAVVVGVAALNLVMDFDFIEAGVAAGAPKRMEWYAAFGLMVTLVWLYLEILRLLGKVMSRRG